MQEIPAYFLKLKQNGFSSKLVYDLMNFNLSVCMKLQCIKLHNMQELIALLFCKMETIVFK